jgi:NAD+ diphosphatase
MIKTPASFIPLMTPEAHPNPLPFIFRAGELLVRASDLALPGLGGEGVGNALPHGLQTAHMVPLGLWQERYCCTTWLAPDTEPEPGFVFAGLRTLFGVYDDDLLGLASRAAQIAEWARTHRHCGVCATEMALAPGERAFQCPACGHIAYPRISPAMMVLIKKGDAILLAHHGRSPAGRFSPLAGFLEAGESIEEAISREVMEEVGLKVDNFQYFGSQSWPFPHSLMIAFTADYVSGEIRVDGQEITEARWFGPEHDLPDRYPELSISGHLVNAHLPRRRGPERQ